MTTEVNNRMKIKVSPIFFVVFAALLIGAIGVPASANTFVVNKTGEPGAITLNGVCDDTSTVGVVDCTLREAVAEANANLGVPDTITFDIPSTDANCTSGVCTINLTSAAGGTLELTDVPANGTTIDGLSQKTVEPGNCTQAAGALGPGPCIVVDGTGLASGDDCFRIVAASTNNTIKGLVIINCPSDGIQVHSSGNTISDNYIGIAADGTTGGAANGNDDDGVDIQEADDNIIGPKNVISNNDDSGVEIEGNRNIVKGNLIGTDATGLLDRGNEADSSGDGNGVLIDGGDDNEIGGTTLADRNVISGNNDEGVEIENSGDERNEILGNIIGLGIDGDTPLGNEEHGIEDNGTGTCVGGRNDTNSGTTCTPKAGALLPNGSAGNLISDAHGDDGYQQRSSGSKTSLFGNFIGTDITGTKNRGNGDDGIDIGGDGSAIIGGPTALEGNLISGNGDEGIFTSEPNNLILGNIIGLNRFGDATAGLGNGDNGIELNSTGNCVGGTDLACTVDSAASRNIISRNSDNGVKIHVNSNTVRGNYIGLNKAGDTAAPNGADGVNIDPSDNNTIGPNNVISGNVGDGVQIDGDNNVVKGNKIGTDAGGNNDVGNGANGVFLLASVNSNANNVIGGITAADRNVISGNGLNGVRITDDGVNNGITNNNNSILGNYIGTNATGTAAISNDEDGVELDAPSTSDDVSDNCIGGLIVSGQCIPEPFTGGGLANNLAGNLISGNGRAGFGPDTNGDNGVEITGGADSNSIISNFIGTDFTGTNPIPNRNNGVFDNSDSFTCIGSSNSLNSCTPVSGVINGRNVISGNGDNGIKLACFAPPNCGSGFTVAQIIANYIGTNFAGNGAIPNGKDGIFIDPDSFNTVGGDAASNPLVRNVISGNLGNGVHISGVFGPPLTVTSTNNRVRGNFIGTAANGSDPLGNGLNGVKLDTGAQFNSVGDGSTSNNNCQPGLGNVIAFNGALGAPDDTAGVRVDGGQSFSDTIRCNSIHDNVGKGISLTNSANNSILPPTVTATSTIDGKANIGNIVDGYNDNNGEGSTYIGEDLADTNCDGAGLCEFTVLGSNPLPNATATQTDNLGDTSEFSNSLTTINCLVAAISSPTTLKFSKHGSKYVYVTVQNQGILAAEITGIAGLIAKNLSITQIKFGKKTLLPPFSITLPPATQQTFKVKLKSSVKQTVNAPYVNVVGNCDDFHFNTPALEGDGIGSISVLVPLALEELDVMAQADQIVAEAKGLGIRSVQLQLFDTTGRVLADQATVGAKLILVSQGQLANGVYLAVLTVHGTDGKTVRSEVKKVLIIR